MNAIDLQRPELLPNELQAHLDSIKHLCINEELSENLVQLPEVRSIVIELNNYCIQRRIIGIHYTRAIRTDIEQRGLLVRTGADIRDEFIRRFGHEFEVAELELLQNTWASHQAKQSSIRDSKLCFNFTIDAFGGSGSAHLLGMYGGEQINMGIEFDTPIGAKLASIGEPLIVKCALDPRKVKTFIDHPWGKILMSSFHVNVAPEAHRIDQDGIVYESILPKDLVVEPTHLP